MRTFSAKSLTKPVFIITFLILNLLGTFIMSHYVQNASATSTSATSSASKNLTLTASVKDALSLALSSNTISLDLTPTPNGIFKTDTFDATVSTSNQTGYTLYVASTGLDHNGEVTSNLIHSSPDVSSDSVISPLEGAVVVSRTIDTSTNPATITYTNTDSFASDRWGLSTDASTSIPNPTTTPTFKPVSTTNTIFGGYESNIEGDTTNFTFGTKVDTNIVAGTYSNTLKITAIANPVYRAFTINYDLAGGTGQEIQVEDIADEYYPTITLNPTAPLKTGFDFLGYATSSADQAAGIVTYQPGDKVQMDYEDPTLNLYAVWQWHDYIVTVTKDANIATATATSDSTLGTDVFHYGDTITLAATITADGYHFTGWETDDAALADSSAMTTTFSMPANDVTVQATSAANTYTLVYNANGGSSAPNSDNITYSTNYQVSSTAPTRTGQYNFLGWSLSSSATVATYAKGSTYLVSDIAAAAGVTDNNGSTITLYAVWQRYYVFSLTYNLNNGSGTITPNPDTVTTTATSNNFKITSTMPTRTGYTFLGWSTSSTATSASYTAGTTYKLSSDASHNGNSATLYAVWQIYSKTFSYTGGIQSVKVPYTGNYTLEVYGAQGGNGGSSGTNGGGYGGYSTGKKYLSANTTLYVVVGGKGGTGNTGNSAAGGAGGYNGGGKGGAMATDSTSGGRAPGGGGGATHIATRTGLLSSLSSYKSTILIVAGGGGGRDGSGCSSQTGTGGGASGGSSISSKLFVTRTVAGGTQSSGYAFGQGQAGTQGHQGWGCGVSGSGGGGGGYYGGYAMQIPSTGGEDYTISGGGGSGYIGGVTSGSTANGKRAGNGYATITWAGS